jgi:2'-5' RNA ligase
MSVLRPSAALRWSPPSNLHITTKFIGAWPEERLADLNAALAGVTLPSALDITVSRFGYFPNPHQPKIFFAGVQAPGMEQLNALLESALEPLGCPREERPWSPHLTLARVGREDIRGLRLAVATLTDFHFGSFSSNRFHLYQSQPAAGGSIYSVIRSFDFVNEKAIAC